MLRVFYSSNIIFIKRHEGKRAGTDNKGTSCDKLVKLLDLIKNTTTWLYGSDVLAFIIQGLNGNILLISKG